MLSSSHVSWEKSGHASPIPVDPMEDPMEDDPMEDPMVAFDPFLNAFRRSVPFI